MSAATLETSAIGMSLDEFVSFIGRLSGDEVLRSSILMAAAHKQDWVSLVSSGELPGPIDFENGGYRGEWAEPFTDDCLLGLLDDFQLLALGTPRNGQWQKEARLLYRAVHAIAQREQPNCGASAGMPSIRDEGMRKGDLVTVLFLLERYGQGDEIEGRLAPLTAALGHALWHLLTQGRAQIEEQMQTAVAADLPKLTHPARTPLMDEAMATRALAVPRESRVMVVPVGATHESEPEPEEGDTSEALITIPAAVEPSPGVATEDSTTMSPLVERCLALVDQNAALREQNAALQTENALLREQLATLSGISEELAALRQQLASVTQLHVRIDDHEERIAALEANQIEADDAQTQTPATQPDEPLRDPRILASATEFLRQRERTADRPSAREPDFTRDPMQELAMSQSASRPATTTKGDTEASGLSWEGKPFSQMSRNEARHWQDYLLDVCLHDFPEDFIAASAKLGREARKRDKTQTTESICMAIARLRLRHFAAQAGVKIKPKNLRALTIHVCEFGFNAEQILGVYIGNKKQAAAEAAA